MMMVLMLTHPVSRNKLETGAVYGTSNKLLIKSLSKFSNSSISAFFSPYQVSELYRIPFSKRLSLSRNAILKKCAPKLTLYKIVFICAIIPFPFETLCLIFSVLEPSNEIMSPR